jgi:hypothetical protein
MKSRRFMCSPLGLGHTLPHGAVLCVTANLDADGSFGSKTRSAHSMNVSAAVHPKAVVGRSPEQATQGFAAPRFAAPRFAAPRAETS